MALVYIVEDDTSIREIEEIALKNSNYTVQSFDRASTFYKRLEEIVPDLVLLDIMLPDEDGYEIIKKMREDFKTKNIPVIMVTAKSTEMDMVKGLDEGADDYIRKPFSVLELLSRVRSIMRRSARAETRQLRVGGIVLDRDRHCVRVDDKNIVLTLKEYELLRYLMQNENIVLSRDAIMRAVWGLDFEGESRSVDMHIKTIRQKLGDMGTCIKTVRGIGYSITAEA